MTDRSTLASVSYLPALPMDADVRQRAAALVDLAFARIESVLNDVERREFVDARDREAAIKAAPWADKWLKVGKSGGYLAIRFGTSEPGLARAARLILEYAAGRPAQTVTYKGDAGRILDQLDNAMLARIYRGEVDGSQLLTMLPVPEVAPEPEDGGL